MSRNRAGIGLVLGGGFVGLLLTALSAGGCTQTATPALVRTLAGSGRVAFVCLDAPSNPDPALPLRDCTTAPQAAQDAGVGASTTNQPNLYALVTQTIRGELAVVDLSTGSVLDEDQATPGTNFLPVGGTPVDIVASPGGTAAFVAVGEVAHAGIFALPGADIRPNGAAPPTLSSWPSCSLPVAPAAMVLVDDTATDQGERASCDGARGASALPTPHGNLSHEGRGRQKLVVSLPDVGGIAVIDAQSVLDADRGAFEPCVIERWLPLASEVPALDPKPPSTGQACVSPAPTPPAAEVPGSPRPNGLAYSEGRLYVADLAEPVVHVVDMPSPCEPHEVAPLLATSVEDPSRHVVTSRVAVAPTLTLDSKRFLYAIDAQEGSTIVFDVTPGAPRTPVERAHPERAPNVPRDRIKFAAPARDVLIVERDSPVAISATGVAPAGTRCDPDSAKPNCDPSVSACDPSVLYRTSTDYLTGAGPARLRGVFAFVLLASGQIAVIDIDDYDAACRGPSDHGALFGCTDEKSDLFTSDEVSCNVVERHAPRAGLYDITSDAAGHHEPALALFPVLSDPSGAVHPIDAAGTSARMVATLPSSPFASGSDPGFAVAVGASRVPISTADGTITLDTDPKHALVMNLEDPRAHAFDQAWGVTYEGPLPGFGDKLAALVFDTSGAADAPPDALVDPNGRFCASGVQSLGAVKERLSANGESAADVERTAPGFADFVVVKTELSDPSDAYWRTPGLSCAQAVCASKFGTNAAPLPAREWLVTEAYQDHLVIAQRPSVKDPMTGELVADPSITDELVKCCFPTEIAYEVRAGHQWVVVGDQTGFLHHVIPNPADGTCRDSCDPALGRLNGRVIEAKAGSVVKDSTPSVAFTNPMFRFAILAPSAASSASVRDQQFRFVTQGSFSPLRIFLSGTSTDVNPLSLSLAPTGELAVPDGASQGLVFVSPDTVGVSRQFF